MAAACVLFDEGFFLFLDVADALFFVALVRDTGFLRAAATLSVPDVTISVRTSFSQM